MKNDLQIKAWNIENLIEAEDDIQVIPLSDANEIMGKKDEEIKKLREALIKISDPIAHFIKEADEQGLEINGFNAVTLANDPSYLKEIATVALGDES